MSAHIKAGACPWTCGVLHPPPRPPTRAAYPAPSARSGRKAQD